jgi:CelD/BcsL family acetyltransferase involved in cellulose biosynthesis
VLHGARGPVGLAEQRRDSAPCPVLALPDSAAALATIVPRKMLRDVRQGASRAEAAGGVRIEATDGDTLASMLDDLFRLHEARWRTRGEPGVLADPAVQEFHRDAARALRAEGMLRLYRMRNGGAVAAVYYGFAWRSRSYAYLGGFDPDMPRLSPGAQIMRYAIGAAIAEGCAAFDFLRGGESYKYAWGAVDRWNIARTWRRR